MSNEENPHELPPEHGGWQPIPQGGEYDAEATAFLQLPPEGALDAAPLEAPGHGYVPPMITPLTPAAADPAATGGWAMPHAAVPQGEGAPGAVRWPEPAETSDPHATGQWNFAAAEPVAQQAAEPVQSASELTGRWTIPVAGGDLPEESGEFTTSALAAQWGAATAQTSPRSTLPGGAPAPWAPSPDAPATLPGGASAPWATAPEPAAVAEEPAPETAEGETAPADVPEEEAAAPTSSTDSNEHPPTSYVLRVNGTDRPVTDAWIGESLLYVLRERLGLAGAKDGCSQGECGACNVQVDGRLVASCLVPAATAAGSEVRTVEGLATDGEPSDVQRALAGCGAVQCGFCIPGMAMTVHDLLEGNHAPTELETRQALCGNLCRCSGYRGVLDAVREVVAERGASASAAAEASEEARIPHQAPPGAGSVQHHPHDGGMA
ncbi:(2Fe-2S)-binding protein [Streptomyces lunaelactis]|uniref:(2Fe-2S)-binding protein n=1 Tax=Streptomyces lunaelactis TaxID=1535768 RepID=UPI001584F233|nr:(2Fe-2S)-binding protein [Streptomyces lunaelactis]NUK36745.1 (2Fe-2S)-binding protein [Streptomyces lunaelactis]NUK43228.1 (2Fe-2S)-binding protein [Streptomyces lunaelactis]NUK72818.1 (2Fe-2S)-binding protein [Streptomyces lunaelactis]NUK82018.1 (2Fe-2S)-binding protein [Streptomyces lunaelactis]NUK94032.1 (2Fe-2S)-binding protein [Streptomyces lunaelactis]